jgi:hypothetical protein
MFGNIFSVSVPMVEGQGPADAWTKNDAVASFFV